MKRFCIYWLCISLCGVPSYAASVTPSDIAAMAFRASRPETVDVPPPKLSKPVVTYRTETRYRSVPYRVKMCQNGRCWFETRYYQQSYMVQVPVASSQRVLGVPGTAPVAPRVVLKRPSWQRSTGPVYSSTHRTRGHWTWPGDLRWHLVSKHGVNRTWAATASAEALMNEHDRLHRGR